MSIPEDAQRVRSIVDATWIISENWLNYIEFHDRKISAESILAGYSQILELLRPYLCADPCEISRESYLTIQQMTPHSAAHPLSTQTTQHPVSVASYGTEYCGSGAPGACSIVTPCGQLAGATAMYLASPPVPPSASRSQ